MKPAGEDAEQGEARANPLSVGGGVGGVGGGGGGGGGDGSLLGNRAPPGEDSSFHQAVIYAQHADDPGTQRQFILSLATLMTVAQCICICGALSLTLWASCESSDQCLDNPGQFCGFGARSDGSSPCAWCGTWAPLDIEFNADGTTFNFPEDQDHFAGFNAKTAYAVCHNANLSFAITPPPGHGLHPNPSAYTCLDYVSETESALKMCNGATELGMPSPNYKEYVESWCTACVDPVTGTVDGMNAWLLPADNIQAMGFASYLCYMLMVLTVALAVLAVHKDVAVCMAAASRLQAQSKLPPATVKQLAAISFLRRWVLSPALIWALFVRVIFKGGHPFTLMSQTVPILMLGLVDRVAYHSGLVDGVRRRTEAAGRTELTVEQKAHVSWGQMMHLIVLPIGSLIPLPIMATGVQSRYLKAFAMPFVFTLIAALLEATGPGLCTKPEPLVMALVFAKFLGGVFCFALLAVLNAA
jgi:hypothetical protein